MAKKPNRPRDINKLAYKIASLATDKNENGSKANKNDKKKPSKKTAK